MPSDFIVTKIPNRRNPRQPPMAATADQHEARPLLLLRRLPRFTLPFMPFLHAAYTLLDPLSEPPDPSFPVLSRSARILLCVGPSPLTSEDLDRYPAVECVVASSAGTNHIDLAACRRRGIRLTSAGDAFSDDVADYAVGLAMDVLRRVSAADRFVRAGLWPIQKEYLLGSRLSGKRIGIIGLGSIGLRVARRFEAFNCSISYNSRCVKSHVPYTYYPNVVELASNIDVLIICCALTNETHHVINKDVMKALGKAGVVVNIARGAIIDEKELVGFLVRGEIGGAGLDVFEHEPRVPNEMMALDNVVLSPHRAVFTPESFAALQKVVIGNIQAFFSNECLLTEIELGC